MANNLIVTGNLGVGGTLSVTGTVDFPGGALDTDLVTNFNADKVDGADLDTTVTLGTSDVKVPSQKAVKTYADARKAECVALTGDQTVAGVKTFSSAIMGDLTGDVTGNADTATLADEAEGVVETGAGAVTLKCKVIEIGDWNMDSTHSVSVAHGLTVGAIRSVGVTIRDDAGTDVKFNTAPALNPADGTLVGGAVNLSWQVSAGNIVIVRLAGGGFDSAGWNSTSFNRGWITIWYEA